MRDKIFDIVEGNSDLFISKLINWIILLTILVSSVAFILESVQEYYDRYEKEFGVLDDVVVIIFTIEYVIRLVTVRKRLQFVFKALNIIDLLAILPFYMEIILGGALDLRILRVIRLVRIFRLFKVAKYSESLEMTGNVFREMIPALGILAVLMGITLILFSSLMYSAERDAHISYCFKTNPDGTVCQGKWVDGVDPPDKLECPVCHRKLEPPSGNAQVAKNFRSIVSSFWWCVVTMTTVGYGDVVPQTPMGKVIAGLTMLAGILCIALPTGVLATAFNSQFEEARKKKQKELLLIKQNEEITCPHCHQKFKKTDG